MSKFVELFPRDMKFFLNKEFSFGDDIKNLLNAYEEFLTINKGFVESEYNTDIKLPNSVKIDNAESYKEKIDEVLKTQDLSNLLEYLVNDNALTGARNTCSCCIIRIKKCHNKKL